MCNFHLVPYKIYLVLAGRPDAQTGPEQNPMGVWGLSHRDRSWQRRDTQKDPPVSSSSHHFPLAGSPLMRLNTTLRPQLHPISHSVASGEGVPFPYRPTAQHLFCVLARALAWGQQNLKERSAAAGHSVGSKTAKPIPRHGAEKKQRKQGPEHLCSQTAPED